MEWRHGLLAQVEGFLEAARKKASPQALSTEAGPRYIRVISSDGRGSRGVYCFIDKSNGDILKAASWKGPAKGARANIFAADFGVSGVTQYGAIYR